MKTEIKNESTEIKITREYVASVSEEYKEILETEINHKHIIVEVDGIFRWKENTRVRKLVDIMGLNEVTELFYHLGLGKNSEAYRQLYRDIGYSLSGYWEIFYWDLNNEDCSEYNHNQYLIRNGEIFDTKVNQKLDYDKIIKLLNHN